MRGHVKIALVPLILSAFTGAPKSIATADPCGEAYTSVEPPIMEFAALSRFQRMKVACGLRDAILEQYSLIDQKEKRIKRRAS